MCIVVYVFFYLGFIIEFNIFRFLIFGVIFTLLLEVKLFLYLRVKIWKFFYRLIQEFEIFFVNSLVIVVNNGIGIRKLCGNIFVFQKFGFCFQYQIGFYQYLVGIFNLEVFGFVDGLNQLVDEGNRKFQGFRDLFFLGWFFFMNIYILDFVNFFVLKRQVFLVLFLV